MGLSGLDIFKLLPKTNCGDCGKPTCLAFAMQLAAKKAQLDECPHASDEAKASLAGAAAPPIRGVTLGTGDRAVKLGEETVLFRHDEKFYNPTAMAFRLEDTLDQAALAEQAKEIEGLQFDRVGMHLTVELIAVENVSGDGSKFAQAVKVVGDNSSLGLILMSSEAEAMKAALDGCADRKPLLYAADADNYEAMAALAKKKACPLAVVGKDLDSLAELTEKVKAAGVEDLVIDSGARETKKVLHDLTMMRRAALKKTFRPLGFPNITFTTEKEPYPETAQAATYLAKYASMIVMRGREPWQVLPLLTERMNLYTDPQKPIQVEPKLYEINNPDENSPLMFTTNFSLTYFTVEGDVEASRVPSYILAVDTEGTSVLTAYSGDKLNEKTVAEAMKKADVESKVKHRKLIIPGYIAVLSGKLEEATGWEILVGPKECSFLPKYLQQMWKP